jgi:hypothetical protein
MIRITADLDNIPLSVARARTIAIINYLFHLDVIFDSRIIRKSSSKKGCHVILWTRNNLDKQQIIFIRYLLGDDTKRIKRDLLRRRPKQYLFKKKVRIRMKR